MTEMEPKSKIRCINIENDNRHPLIHKFVIDKKITKFELRSVINEYSYH